MAKAKKAKEANETSKENKTSDIDLGTIYKAYVDLYIHLDKLTWIGVTSVIGIYVTAGVLLYKVLTHDITGCYFPFVGFVVFLALSALIYRYKETLGKFNKGKDSLVGVLCDIEINSGLFTRDIQVPDQKKFRSFFSRRAAAFNNADGNKRMFFALKRALDYVYYMTAACTVIFAVISLLSL